MGAREEVGLRFEAAHVFGALNTLLMTVLLGLCFLCAYLIKKHKFYYVPESAAAILVGVVVGGLAKLFNPTKDELDFLRFNPELFYFLLLPPIIFEAGYTVRKGHFFQNLGTITLFAVFGTLASTISVGYLLFGAAKLGLVKLDADSPMEPLMFGALISAVDPVATLSIMGSPELNCDPLLYSLVFGESVLNDAVAIVLFNTFLGEYAAHEEFTTATLPSVLWSFTTTSLGSLSLGAFVGFSCAFLYKHTRIRDQPKYETALLFIFAYGSYSFTEALGLSGIMALFFNGLILSHYNIHNLSSVAKVTSQATFMVLATLSEFLIYLYMGMGVFTGRFKSFDWGFLLVALVIIVMARATNIFPLSFIANFGRRRKITLGMQAAMWFAGLRGAIAFALSQSMPGRSKEAYESTTLMIVIFTTLVCGGLTAPLLGKLNVKLQHGLSEEAYDANPYEQLGIVDGDDDPNGGAGGANGVLGATAAQRFRQRRRRLREKLGGSAHSLWIRVDGEILQPLFGGPLHNGVDDEDDVGVEHVHEHEMRGMGPRLNSGESFGNSVGSNDVSAAGAENGHSSVNPRKSLGIVSRSISRERPADARGSPVSPTRSALAGSGDSGGGVGGIGSGFQQSKLAAAEVVRPPLGRPDGPTRRA